MMNVTDQGETRLVTEAELLMLIRVKEIQSALRLVGEVPECIARETLMYWLAAGYSVTQVVDLVRGRPVRLVEAMHAD
jgi:hypothetical protein